MAHFTLSAFGDEIADDFEEQLKLLKELELGLDIRKAWGIHIQKLTDVQIQQVKQLCADYGIKVHCLGSWIGKTPITDPLDAEIANLERLFVVGEMLDVRDIRLFSFYPPEGATAYDDYVQEATARLQTLTEKAAQAGFQLLLENEKHIVGDTPERCHKIASTINHPNLRLIWDPANYVQVGVMHQVERYWDLLNPYTTYIHIKDAFLNDGAVCAAGEGDGQVINLLSRLKAKGYEGILSLEPHLVEFGRNSGFSGPDGMIYATKALHSLLEQL